ncbi:unnamed protein product [Rhizoctonia solani]|uniref:F-box domain-containing protein n=1 Tax=Rhizoctonia solani TaxID=456999 RepID=A0A8H3C3K0_9AGAM|nr:unnamed protein product [Rhizoctonia solani]
MLEDLRSASSALNEALDHYVNICAKLRNHYFEERAADKLDELLDHVANELQLVAWYGTKLKKADASLKVIRNSSTTTVPINRLPQEVLTRVFHIVVDDQPEILDATHAPFQISLSFPKHPEALSHVCFEWRQTALASHSLWTQIDLVLHHPLGPGFLSRAKAHVERAGRLPLDVRMVDPTLGKDYLPYGKPYDFNDYDFLAFAETPMHTLSLVSYHGLQNQHCEFIGYCIINSARQTLEKLNIKDATGRGGPYRFIESADSFHDPKSLQIELSEQLLDSFWCSASVLHLSGLYPYWTTRAYHRLTDLRLGSDKAQFVPVSEAHIVEILKASPGLRTFHLHLDLIESLPENAPVEMIHLEELESLNLSTIVVDINPSQILRFINPGRKPLQISISDEPTDVVEQFLKRSNVTQLRMITWGTYPPFKLLCLCPDLQVLVLDVWGTMDRVNFQTIPEQGDDCASDTPISVRSLYVLRCDGIGMVDLQKLVKNHSVQELTLWKTYPKSDGESKARDAYKSEVCALCSVVNYLMERDRSPIDDWDQF